MIINKSRPFARIRQHGKGRPRPGMGFSVQVQVHFDVSVGGKGPHYYNVNHVVGSGPTGGKPEAERLRDLLNEAWAKYMKGDIPDSAK